jgi:hypothetical protein
VLECADPLLVLVAAGFDVTDDARVAFGELAGRAAEEDGEAVGENSCCGAAQPVARMSSKLTTAR